jgi:proline iminopeptidase
MTPFGLDERVLDLITAALREHPGVQRAVIFGSRATGSFKPHSDIDIGVYAPAMDVAEFARLSFEIRELPIVFTMDVLHVDKLDNDRPLLYGQARP